MRKMILLLGSCLILVGAITGQQISRKLPADNRPDWPQIQRVVSHDRNFTKTSGLSFYKRKSEWQKIIDSTWGPGLPLASKLQLFDSYAQALTEKFDGFVSLGISWASWDSIKTAFRSRINDSTSRGAFAAIMSHFAWQLRDGHTQALDTVVTSTPLNPGVPLLNIWPMSTAEHFGAVLTALPDSTALVLRTVQNHPLGLEPGDVVLGYEGVSWKRLVRELMLAWLPINSSGEGAASAEIHTLIRSVGN
ncbi:MAG TPA: hypothetical protein VMG09_18305, partial [Bacteroidota bacterium]|nr:hypothetical protein [Bacteroidota bacterium]